MRGSSCRALEEPLPLPAACKGIPNAIRGVGKKPAAGGKTKKLEKKPAGVKAGRELSNTRDCVYSRAYHATWKRTRVRAEAQKAGQDALIQHFGYCCRKAPKLDPHGTCD